MWSLHLDTVNMESMINDRMKGMLGHLNNKSEDIKIIIKVPRSRSRVVSVVEHPSSMLVDS